MGSRNLAAIILGMVIFLNCNKSSSGGNPPPPPPNFISTDIKLNGQPVNVSNYNTPINPVIKFYFSAAINRNTVNSAFSFKDKVGNAVPYTASYENNDNVVVMQPSANLNYLTKYSVSVSSALKSTAGGNLTTGVDVSFITKIDSSRKFPIISDDSLLTLVQRQTFKYFWDFGHPTSGMARERSNGDNNVVTTGGTGFGIMGILVAVNRNFITRIEGLMRVQKIVSF